MIRCFVSDPKKRERPVSCRAFIAEFVSNESEERSRRHQQAAALMDGTARGMRRTPGMRRVVSLVRLTRSCVRLN